MTSTTMNPTTILRALSMIDLARWGIRGRLLALVAAETTGASDGLPPDWLVPLSRSDLGDWFYAREKRSHRWMWEAALGLVEDGVLVRVAGMGSRPSAWGINAEPSEWRHVPWAVERPVALLALRGDASAARDWRQSPVCRPVAPGHKRYLWSGQLGVQERGLSSGNSPDHKNEFVARQYRTTNVRRSGGGTVLLRSINRSSCNGDDEQSSPSAEIRALIARKTGGGAVYGAPGRRLDELARNLNGAQAHVLERLEAEQLDSPVAYVAVVEAILACANSAPEPARPAALPELSQARSRVAALEAMDPAERGPDGEQDLLNARSALAIMES